MKNYDEYADHIRSKANHIRKRRRIAWSCAAMFVLTLGLTLFIPYRDQAPNVDRYQNSPYYKLIPGLNKATYQSPTHKNNYEWLKDVLSLNSIERWGGMNFVVDAPTAMPEGGIFASGTPIYGIDSAPTDVSGSIDQTYEEVTDNQVQGVTEADIFKRSDKYIYYLRRNCLSVYSIDKENSAEIAKVELAMDGSVYSWNYEMFLSTDCTTLTILSQQTSKEFGACTVVYSLDVTDPTQIVERQPLYFMGSYVTARVVGDALLLIYNYNITGEIDFDHPETFVPVYGTQEELLPIPAEDIYCPAEEPTSARYTVIAKLDSKTLEVKDTVALLSYSSQVYVSQNAIYATYGCVQRIPEGENYLQTSLTEITGIGYTGDELQILGTVTLEGSVKDQYSLDEYNGILRVATSTNTSTVKESSSRNYSWVTILSGERNCNLYCIDLASWQIASSVIAFAPEGEEVTSARFSGSSGYICTAEVIIMTDPVYLFDLSDIHDITYKHTPVIDGYSSSLINFGDYLLGIGYNERRNLKIEAYRETTDGVEPITAFEREAWFSEVYKSYLIDRETNTLGIAACDNRTGNTYYFLLHFDGYQFATIAQIPLKSAELNTIRADMIDGYLYLLEQQLQVVRLH